jgi:hypothetical protein
MVSTGTTVIPVPFFPVANPGAVRTGRVHTAVAKRQLFFTR